MTESVSFLLQTPSHHVGDEPRGVGQLHEPSNFRGTVEGRRDSRDISIASSVEFVRKFGGDTVINTVSSHLIPLGVVPQSTCTLASIINTCQTPYHDCIDFEHSVQSCEWVLKNGLKMELSSSLR